MPEQKLIELTPEDKNPLKSDPPTPEGKDVPWGILTKTHPCYNELKIKKRRMLLDGTADSPENRRIFIKKMNKESEQDFEDRLSFAEYQNVFGEVINDFNSAVFSKQLLITPPTDAEDDETEGVEPDPTADWMVFQSHFDLRKRTSNVFMREVQAESNALGFTYFGIDFAGAKPYAYKIDPLCVLDYELGDDGEYNFLVQQFDESPRLEAKGVRDEITSTFLVWHRDTEDEKAKIHYDTYQITYSKKDPPPAEKKVKWISNTPVEELNLIPIVCAETDESLCVGTAIGHLAERLFVKQTNFCYAVNKGINPILAISQGAELPASGDLSVVNEDEQRGSMALHTAQRSGAALLGPADKMAYVEPTGTVLKIAQEALEKDKNEMFRIVNMMSKIVGHFGQTKGNVKTSGISKLIDSREKGLTLIGYANNVKSWMIKAFKIAFPTQDVLWEGKGMEDYKTIDDEDIPMIIAAIPDYIANIPSKKSQEQFLQDIVSGIHPNSSPGTMSLIRKEIKDAVEASETPTLVNPKQDAMDAETHKAKLSQKSKPPTKDQAPQDPPTIGDSGQKLLDQGSHLQTGEHVDWKPIYDQLLKDYKPGDLKWMKQVPWRGPIEVDATDISMQGSEDWTATQPGKEGTEKVDKFADMLKDKGFAELKPVVLANMPHNDEKYTIIDGRHRVMAAQQAGIPILAYVAEVGSMDADTPHMQLHGRQIGANNSGNKSN